MKVDLSGKIMTKRCGLRSKVYSYSYLIDEDNKDKKAKSTKSV